MIPEKVFQQILALGEAWRVVRMDYQEKEQRVLIRVEETPALWSQENCPHCGHKTVRGYANARGLRCISYTNGRPIPSFPVVAG
jgi:Na+-translocating ferredoxin:NAD+ oxidoreductase RNF subunit RnfB